MRPGRRDGASERMRIEAAWLAAAVRIGLWVLPFRTVRRMADRLARPPTVRRGPPAPEAADIGRAVRAAGRLVPRFTCLAEGITAYVLLGRAGRAAELRIGAHRTGGDFEAHAWVVSGGQVVVGGDVTGHAELGTVLERPERRAVARGLAG